MRLTTRGRYAVTALLDVALHSQTGPVTLYDISKRQSIPVPYLGQLFTQMRTQGLVNSKRGPGGGYVLAKLPEQIALLDIIDAVDEKLEAIRCGGKSNCQNNQQCLTHSLWDELENKIRTLLADISLEQAVNNQNILKVAERQDRECISDEHKEHYMPIAQNAEFVSRRH